MLRKPLINWVREGRELGRKGVSHLAAWHDCIRMEYEGEFCVVFLWRRVRGDIPNKSLVALYLDGSLFSRRYLELAMS
jgi:hypothetical protein